jgi:hypothetical protein
VYMFFSTGSYHTTAAKTAAASATSLAFIESQ